MTRIRVLRDFAYDYDEGPALEPGTIIPNALINERNADAYYFNPSSGEDWMSFRDDYEVIDR